MSKLVKNILISILLAMLLFSCVRNNTSTETNVEIVDDENTTDEESAKIYGKK